MLDRKANVVFILIGVNDVGADVTAKDYEASLRNIVGQLQKAGTTVVLGTPILHGEKTDNTNPKDGPMNEFTGVCQRICEDNGVMFCNLRAAAQAHLKVHNKENNEKGILTTDGVHLTADGNRLVAEKVAQAIAEALRMRAMQQWIGPGHGLAKWDGADVPFKDKDKVIFFGDSITSGATSPNGYITVLGRELRAHHPELQVQLVNKGNSGNKVPNLQSRLHSDVLSQKPNAPVHLYRHQRRMARNGVGRQRHAALRLRGRPAAHHRKVTRSRGYGRAGHPQRDRRKDRRHERAR